MAGHFRIPHPNSQAWPKEPIFTQFLTRIRLEADIRSLVIDGVVPKELNGTFHRVYPDPAFPPYVENNVVSKLLYAAHSVLLSHCG
jgi:carotenoid cleavage dioxygenase-like enzyme